MKNKALILYGIFFSLFLLISGCISIPVLKNKSDYSYKSNYQGLESSDTGERRATALDSFNTNLDLLTEKIAEVVASASS